MSLSRNRHIVLMLGCLLMSACSDNSYQQQPVATDIQLQDSNSHLIAGEPGLTVDCKQSLPCRWNSSDTQFSLTVNNVDNTATRSRLAINYSIATAHDTDVFISRANDALDADGVYHKATGQSLGGGNGGIPQGVVAGTDTQGALYFDKGTDSDSIVQWSVTLLDGGVNRTASFTDLPVGPLRAAQADCQNSLPCIWTTPLGDVTVTLQSLGGIAADGNLSAEFTIVTTNDRLIALDAGSTALGSDGTRFDGNVHTLQAETDHGKVLIEATAGTPVQGSVDFYRTLNVPDSLQLLSLLVYGGRESARWNPEFVDIPVLD